MAALHRLDAGEELLIKHYAVAVLAQPWRHLLRQGLQVVAGAGAQQVAHHRLHPGEQLAAALQGEHRVFKRRLVGIADDSLNLCILAAHALLQGRLKVLLLNAVEGRRAVRSGIWFKERILSHRRTGLLNSQIVK